MSPPLPPSAAAEYRLDVIPLVRMSSSQLWTPPQISAHRIRCMIDSKLRAAHTGSCRSAERHAQRPAHAGRAAALGQPSFAWPVRCSTLFAPPLPMFLFFAGTVSAPPFPRLFGEQVDHAADPLH